MSNDNKNEPFNSDVWIAEQRAWLEAVRRGETPPVDKIVDTITGTAIGSKIRDLIDKPHSKTLEQSFFNDMAMRHGPGLIWALAAVEEGAHPVTSERLDVVDVETAKSITALAKDRMPSQAAMIGIAMRCQEHYDTQITKGV